MKLKTCITSLALLEGLVCISAQNAKIIPANTIAITPTDSKELIIEKAAHVIPTKNQLDALRNEFIAFIHFGPNTFTRMEWGNGMEDPKIFDLKELDTDQWCKSLKDAGMKMVILTVKHHDGFVLWQSRYTDHGIMSTNFRNGKGDILRDLSKSCQKYGLKLGLYLSPADLYQIENPKGLYGNLSQYTKRTIPREVPGRPFSNKTKFEFEVDDYNEYFLNQLFEILTEYGPIHEVWFDGAHPKTKGGQKYNYEAWKKLIHTLAPKAVIFGQGDVRWCGNEAGVTRKTEWNVLPFNNKDLTEITGLTKEEYQQTINLALEDARNMRRLSDSLMDLAKASYDPNEISFSEIRLDEVLLESYLGTIKENPQYKVALHIDDAVEERQLTIQGNEYLLRVAFNNLIDNACKYSPEHSCSVNISVDSNNLRIDFTNTGVTIAQEDLQHIFEPFYRSENSRTEKGHGIGLFLTEKVINLHHAEISVTSENHKTSFTVVFRSGETPKI